MRIATRTPASTLLRTAVTLTLCTCIAWAASGCAGGESEAQLIASAKTFIAKNDNKAAVIQLKNALQKNGDSPEARLLLGQVLLQLGDPTSAAVELRKARALNIDEEVVVPDLARALLLSGQDDKVLAEFGSLELKTADARARLATQVASAYMVRGNAEKTDELAGVALEAVPTHAPAITLKARVLASKADIPGALALLDTVLQREPGHLEAGLFRGDILRTQKDGLEPALAQYQAVLAKHPESIATHSAVLTGLLSKGDKAAAIEALKALQQLAPAHPDTVFFQAQMAYDEGKFAEARDLSNRVLKMAPNSVRVLELSAASAYRLNDYAQAELMLTQALKQAPGQLLARHMLAQTYLRIGQPERAMDTLKPLLEAPLVNPNTLALAGEVFLLQGNAKQAEEAFAAASLMVPDDVRLRTSVAMSQVARSNADPEAMRSLESLAKEDSSPRADLALVSARLSQKDYAGALKALDGLAKKQPDRAMVDNLRGKVRLQQGDKTAARASFEAALKKEPKFLPAAVSLSMLDLNEGKREQARTRLEALAKADPNNPDAAMAVAEVASRTGASAEDVGKLLGAAIRANAATPRPHIALVTHWLASGNARAALTAAQAGAAALPDDPNVQDALGQALLANGDRQQALSTWRALASQQPKQPAYQLRLSEALAGNKNYDEAEASLKRALDLSPGLISAERALVTLAIQRGQPQDGLPVARGLQKRLPKDAVGWMLEGDIEMARKNTAPALAAYRKGVELGTSVEPAIRLHRSLQIAGQPAEADSFAAQWVKDHPKDGTFPFYLGDAALARRDLNKAEVHYRAALAAVPGNALAMNNIAWIMATQGKPGAVAMATQANELAPDRGPLLDTLAQALAAEGQVQKAIDVQKRALAQAPTDPGLKLTLAKLYIKAGEKVFARAELEEVSSMGDKFVDQAQVTELLKQVR